TLWIDLNTEKMVLVWRDNLPVRTIKMKGVDHILGWIEPLAEPPRPASYCPNFLAEKQRADAAKWERESPEAEAAAAAAAAAQDAELEKKFADFDKEMDAADKEITAAAAAVEEKWAAEKAAMIAAGVDPALLEPETASQSPAESLRALIQGSQPEDAALI